MSQHDLIVIGAGPGGYVAALRAAQLGLKVACVEREPVLGGTCLRIGCIPSKALLESSELFERAGHDLAAHGVKIDRVSLDLAAMMARKEKIVSGLARGIDGLFRKAAIHRIAGDGSLAGEGRVRVAGINGRTELSAKWILLATGSRPATLPGVALDGDRIGTSTEALAWPDVPGHLVVIGAGYIGLELGSVWRRLGARVTVLEYLDRILPGTDGEIAAEAQRILAKQGIEFRLGTAVSGATRKKGTVRVECREGEPVECDRLLLSVGRVPNTEGLNLDVAGVELDERGRIRVNDHFETTAAGVFAIGDVIPGPMLAHKAEEEGIACVERLVTGYGHFHYDTIPSVCYTEPEIAAVGRTEEQLREEGVEYRKGTFPFAANGRALALGTAVGRVKILADAATDRVLGVHVLGPRAGDLIAEAAAAMAFGASSEDIARVCHAHPTLAEAVKEAALAVTGRALHV